MTKKVCGGQAIACLVVSGAACASVYVFTGPAVLSLRYSLTMGLLFATLLTVLRASLLERHYRVPIPNPIP